MVAVAGAVWRMRLASAFRTALACAIVECTTLYGPASIRHQLRFPAFSYVTVILIVSDATLGCALRGVWHAIYATVLVLPPSILCLWIVGPVRFSAGSAGLAVGVSAFFVGVLPISLMSKRIALGELVIVYVGAVIHGHSAGSFMHPTHVAASTVLGAFASLLALLLPYPWLAFTEVKKLFQLYTENASERTNLFMKAYFSQDNATANELISQAKPFAETGAKLLQHMKLIQEGVKWERPWTRDFKPHFASPGDRLQDMETPIRGMEIALTCIPSFPVSMINQDQDFHNVLLSAEVEQALKYLEEAKCFLPSNAIMTVPERKGMMMPLGKSLLHSLAKVSPTQRDLPAFFFLSCMELLLTKLTITLNPPESGSQITTNSAESQDLVELDQKARFRSFARFLNIISNVATPPSNKALLFAFKCSLALGLAVILGLIFNKENGYWSGLTIAISFVTERQPTTFTVANARAQGTAMGSVYGVLGCFVLQRITEIRFAILLPWIIFTSFLRHSQMYGQAGGISAVIGALLILGRKNYGPPDEFAITRLTEASIGLLCLIIVEFILQPARAATLAKHQLSKSMEMLHQCTDQIVLCSTTQKEEKGAPISIFLAMRANQLRKLKSHTDHFIKFSKDAESEPDFWFFPFRASCYYKLHETLSRMVDLLQFMTYSIDFLLQVPHNSGLAWRELLQQHINSDLELWKENIGPCLKRLEKISLIKSIDTFEQQQLQQGKIFQDLESGKPQTLDVIGVSTACCDDTAAEKVLNSFLQHSKEVIDKILTNEGEEEFKGKTILHLNTLGFCISRLMRETIQVEEGIKDLVRWENPSRHVDFHQLFSKIDAVYS